MKLNKDEFIMVDLETLGSSENASIIQIGMCHYKYSHYRTVSRTVKPDFTRSNLQTIQWWLDDGDRVSILNDLIEAPDCHNVMAAFLWCYRELADTHDPDTQWWFRGKDFDVPMLREQTTFSAVPFRNLHELRTIEALVGLGNFKDQVETNTLHGSHDAGFDAEHQARQLVDAFKRLP